MQKKQKSWPRRFERPGIFCTQKKSSLVPQRKSYWSLKNCFGIQKVGTFCWTLLRFLPFFSSRSCYPSPFPLLLLSSSFPLSEILPASLSLPGPRLFRATESDLSLSCSRVLTRGKRYIIPHGSAQKPFIRFSSLEQKKRRIALQRKPAGIPSTFVVSGIGALSSRLCCYQSTTA